MYALIPQFSLWCIRRSIKLNLLDLASLRYSILTTVYLVSIIMVCIANFNDNVTMREKFFDKILQIIVATLEFKGRDSGKDSLHHRRDWRLVNTAKDATIASEEIPVMLEKECLLTRVPVDMAQIHPRIHQEGLAHLNLMRWSDVSKLDMTAA
ncbi:hypothetical protein BJY52DRAFT_1228526 [Lactarius psammicola]|nr:hypothetical protein BJY52DRAFT_1228526 [Lactarius psammicola]